jgi:hypothetical protein
VRTNRGCLFCRATDGGFDSREHVFPESIGNTEHVLPPGIVCDRCNHGELSRLDNTLCDFTPIAARRTMLGIPSKAGKIPQHRFSEGTIDHVPSFDGADPTLIFKSNGPQQLLKETERVEGQVKFQFNFTGGPRLTPRYASDLSRSLLKSALECAWLQDPVGAFAPKFDHVRAAVLGERRDGFLSAIRKMNPDTQTVSLTYNLFDSGDAEHMLVYADYFGVILVTDSRLPQPVGEIPTEHWNLRLFQASDIRSRKGQRLARP